ncbi:hypothetical protein PoB_002232000 [Plakobranchus ocellatus]|uniref:C-type lectin domain-containing protein n=1 Tax=Plakobranchus ocellatus TaxID=259542 RepID=A0AAV3ZMP2_9GAST|nr:hypothetical protein PoB_002232000 [Plakobranchus ocellatus]
MQEHGLRPSESSRRKHDKVYSKGIRTKNRGLIWIGLRRFRGEDKWRWVDGDVEFVYPVWWKRNIDWCMWLSKLEDHTAWIRWQCDFEIKYI